MKPEKVHEKFCPILANFSRPIKVCGNVQKGDLRGLRYKTHIHIQNKKRERKKGFWVITSKSELKFFFSVKSQFEIVGDGPPGVPPGVTVGVNGAVSILMLLGIMLVHL